jgi:hypothetical protein
MITSLNLILEAQLVGKTIKDIGNKGLDLVGSKIEDAWICIDHEDPILRLRFNKDNFPACISLDPNDTFTLED